jgi:hypothetical protein
MAQTASRGHSRWDTALRETSFAGSRIWAGATGGERWGESAWNHTEAQVSRSSFTAYVAEQRPAPHPNQQAPHR